jgi:putative copper export protein
VTLSVLTTLQQWVLFTATAAAVGCVAWRFVVLRGVARSVPDATRSLAGVERHVASLGVLVVLVLIAAWALRMVVQVWSFRDPFAPLRDDVSFLLFQTFWGTTWMIQGATLLLLGVAFWRSRHRGVAAWSLTTALTLALVATLALSSHAMGVDVARPFFVVADGIHALAAGSWIGSLGIILVAGRPERIDGRTDLFAAQIRAFSPLAVVSVAALVTMGTVLAWTHLDGVSSLWSTGYGLVLAAKVTVAAVVLLAGFRNWRVGVPRLDSAEGAGALRQRATVEVSVAVVVLLLTAVLVHSTKP